MIQPRLLLNIRGKSRAGCVHWAEGGGGSSIIHLGEKEVEAGKSSPP